MPLRLLRLAVALLVAASVLLRAPALREVVTTRPERPASIRLTRPGGGLVRLAVAAPIVRPDDLSTRERAASLVDVLRQDLDFEGAFELISPEATAALPVPRSPRDPVLLQWRDADLADGFLVPAISVHANQLTADIWVFDAASGGVAFARGFSGPIGLARLMAHTIADELHLDQAGVRGIACTQIVFVSDRAGSHKDPTGVPRRVKEIYAADYDGANQRRLTGDFDLALSPSLSPDRRGVAYTSYRRGYQDLFIVRPNDHRVESPTAGRGKNWLPSWSPDGSRIAFTSNRGGNAEIYVMKPDGSDTRRVTQHYAIDSTPAWSPDGQRIAFTSDRTGRPQIWVSGADGSNPTQFTDEKYCDRPTWSVPPFNEIAYVSRTRTGFDIVVKDVVSGERRQLTAGRGNESPVFSPNGRHLAFTSRRSGSEQIWVVSRDGARFRQVTHIGNNTMPDWK
jgi:TolB protein